MELCTLRARLPLQETGRTEWKDRDGDDSSGSWTVGLAGGGGRGAVPGVGETLGDVPKFLGSQFPLL